MGIVINMYVPHIGTNQKQYVNDCLDSNMLSWRGKYVKMFEDKLADYIGVKHCISVFNGSVAIYAVLKCVKSILPADTEVIVPTMTYVATVSQAMLAGYRIKFVDCDSNFQIDLNQVEQIGKSNVGVKIVLVPELYADAPDMKELTRICSKYNLLLIEDSAEAFGCSTYGQKLGTFGFASTFSFFANKIITCGEGGCIATNNDELADQLRLFRNQGDLGYYRHVGPCSNLRMTNIQAAIGLAQLEDIDNILFDKRFIADFYRMNLASYDFSAIKPKIEFSSEWMPVFQLKDGMKFKEFNEYCNLHGFETRHGFYPVHLMKGFENQDTSLSLANSESMIDRYFILPCYPNMNDNQLEYIVEKVNNFGK